MKDSYMDGIIHSAEKMEEANENRRDIEFILKQGNYHIKNLIVNGKSEVENNVD